jgi:hypothetical protein
MSKTIARAILAMALMAFLTGAGFLALPEMGLRANVTPAPGVRLDCTISWVYQARVYLVCLQAGEATVGTRTPVRTLIRTATPRLTRTPVPSVTPVVYPMPGGYP